eukprot:scaffold35161_cov153-Amphora_coffeaeformis.AAC.2
MPCIPSFLPFHLRRRDETNAPSSMHMVGEARHRLGAGITVPNDRVTRHDGVFTETNTRARIDKSMKFQFVLMQHCGKKEEIACM